MAYEVLVVSLLVTFTVVESGHRCFECTDLPHPNECTRVATCSPGQICFVDEFITTGGLLLYNTGCRSTVRCNSSIGKKQETSRVSSLSRRSDIPTCQQCCQNDFCNDEGCGNQALKQPQRGPLCFNCDYANTPMQCRTITRCDHGEMCMLSEIPPIDPGDYTLYRTGCQRPQDCADLFIIGKKRYTHCHVCCKDDFCNDNCANSLTTVAMTNVTTPPPPTTTTTKTVPASSSTTMRVSTSTENLCSHRSGYQFDANSHLCFKFHSAKKSWNDANSTCAGEGATLAVVDTKVKWEYLKHQLQHNHNFHHDAYIGGTAAVHHSGDHFQWPNGHNVSFTAWESHQPNDKDKHRRCIWLHYHGNFAWHDDNCGDKYAFICTINM